MGDGVHPSKGKIDYPFKVIQNESDDENPNDNHDTNHFSSDLNQFSSDSNELKNEENSKNKSIKLFQFYDKAEYNQVWNVEQSENVMACRRAKSLIMFGQCMDWNRRTTLFLSGVSRITTMKGITMMFSFLWIRSRFFIR